MLLILRKRKADKSVSTKLSAVSFCDPRSVEREQDKNWPASL